VLAFKAASYLLQVWEDALLDQDLCRATPVAVTAETVCLGPVLAAVQQRLSCGVPTATQIQNLGCSRPLEILAVTILIMLVFDE